MDGRGQKPHKLMAGRLHGICAGLKPQAFQKTVLDIGGVLLLTAIEGNVHRSGLHAGIFHPLQIRRPQQGGCLSRSSASQEKNGCSLRSQHILQKLLQGHSPAISSLPHNRIESLFLPYIGQSRICPHRAKHCRPACLPQRPVGDALSLNPVLELLQIQPHLLRALIAASGQRGKSLFQNFLHHAPHSLRHVHQAGGLGDVRRCAAKHLHGRQVLPCKTAIKYSGHGIQVTGLANLTCFSRPNLRRRIPLLGAVVHRPAEAYFLQGVNAVVINQGDALPPALSDEQNVVRADIQVQKTKRMKALQHIQGPKHPADVGQKTRPSSALGSKLLIQASSAGKAKHGIIGLVQEKCIQIGVNIPGILLLQPQVHLISPAEAQTVQLPHVCRLVCMADVLIPVPVNPALPVIGKQLLYQHLMAHPLKLRIRIRAQIHHGIGPSAHK